MHHFHYRDGELHAEGVAVSQIAAAVGTPFYCYSTATLERHYKVLEEALPRGTLIAFAVKSNGSLAVIRTLARLGAGADIVSGGELKRAIAGGIPASKIVFSGVGKTREEIDLALSHGIRQFNAESEEELLVLNAVALSRGQRASVALRINPDVDARTHAKISTGKAENKFGIAWHRAEAAFRKAAQLPGIDVAGVDMLRSSHGPVVIEVNSSPGLEGIEKATGVDVASAIIEYVEKRAAPGKTQDRIGF